MQAARSNAHFVASLPQTCAASVKSSRARDECARIILPAFFRSPPWNKAKARVRVQSQAQSVFPAPTTRDAVRPPLSGKSSRLKNPLRNGRDHWTDRSVIPRLESCRPGNGYTGHRSSKRSGERRAAIIRGPFFVCVSEPPVRRSRIAGHTSTRHARIKNAPRKAGLKRYGNE